MEISPAQSVNADPVYFQIFYSIAARRRASLQLTHEPDEIAQQMSMYNAVLNLKTRNEIRVFNADRDIIEKYNKGVFDDLFKAVEYAEKYERGFDPFPVLENAFSKYGPPANIEELMLKAEIAGDRKWADFWTRYIAG